MFAAAIKAASSRTGNHLYNNEASLFTRRVALFHATPVSYRRRKSRSDFTDGYHSRQSPKNGRSSRQSPKTYNEQKGFRFSDPEDTLWNDIDGYADYLFQNWRDDGDYGKSSSSKGPSRSKRGVKRNSSQGFPHWDSYRGSGKGGVSFIFDFDDEEDNIFESAFIGERFNYQSFVIGDDWSQTKKSNKHSNNHKTKWRHRSEDEYEFYEESNENREPDLSSDRKMLGLSTCGPLKLEDVKNAYRTCALKWHPDRHQGSKKGTAEEKFKLCSAAYQSLCEKLE